MFSPKPKHKLSRYQDPLGGMSGKDLERAEWLLRHRLILRRILIISLIIWSAATVGYSGWQWLDYLLFGAVNDQRADIEQVSAWPNYQVLHGVIGAAPINLPDFSVYRSGTDQYDFVAMAENPNPAWKATLTYHAEYGEEKTPSYQTTILPGERRPVAILGHKGNSYPGEARLIVDETKTKWQRINPHIVPDPSAFIAERVRFQFENVRFDRGNGTLVGVPSVQFDLTNLSSYSYWQPQFYVELLSGPQPVGMILISEDQFRAGETRAIRFSLFGDPVTVSDVAVYPVIDVFDEEVYMEPRRSVKSNG